MESTSLRVGQRDVAPVGGARDTATRSRPAGAPIGTVDPRSQEGVVVRLSPEALEPPGAPEDDDTKSQQARKSQQLSFEDQQVVRQLQTRDTAVRAHEAAHQAAAKGLGGAASFSYETGPDGHRYAVGGEVPVQIKSGRTPAETIQNAQIVRAAALAPADPSAQDLAVASEATQIESRARQEVAKLASAPASEAGRDPDHDLLMVFSTVQAERGSAQRPDGSARGHAAAGADFWRRAAAR